MKGVLNLGVGCEDIEGGKGDERSLLGVELMLMRWGIELVCEEDTFDLRFGEENSGFWAILLTTPLDVICD